MTANKSNRSTGRRWRLALMTSTVIVFGLGAAAVIAHETHLGQSVFNRLFARLETKQAGQSEFSSLVEQARQALQQGHPDVAVLFLKKAIAQEPKDGNAHLQLGVALLKVGDTAAAESELRTARQLGVADDTVVPILFTAMLARSEDQQLLTQFPPPAENDKSVLASETLRARAVALNKTGNQKEAVASLDRALSFDRSPANLIARAQFARSMQDPALAMKLLDDALAKAPKNALALVTQVDLLMQAKDAQKALATANRLVEYYPNNAEALMTRAGVYLQMQQHDKALADIDASLKAAPQMPLGVYYKALAMEQAKDVKQAWDLAQNLPPGFVNSRPEIASAVSQMAANAGHLEIGTSILSATVMNFPKNIDARVRLAARYLQLKDAARALQTLQPVADSSDPRILVLLAQAYTMQGNYAKSVTYLEKAKTTGIGGDLLKRQIAIAHLQAGNLDAALSELAALNAAKPGDSEIAGPYIDALVRKSAFAKADEVAAKLTSAAPDDPHGPFFQGQLLLGRGDIDGAVSAFSRAVAINHSFVPALYQRAAAYVARGELSAADGDMRAVLAVSADNMMAQISRAQIATQSGEKEKAEILLKQAVAAHPQEPLPSLVLSSFDMQQGRFDDAAGVISDFLNKVPGNPNAIAMRGQIELAAGKPDQAVTTFRQLAATYPKLPQIQMLLATALTKMGKTKEALSAYQQAVELAPMMQAAHVGLIQLALANKDEAGALAAAQDYAEKQPGPVSADTLARTYASLNRISDAIDVLTRSQAKYPDGTTIVALTTLLRKQGEIKKADAMLADWIAKHPNDVGARMAYAGEQLPTDPAVAAEQYAAVLKSQPYNPGALNNMAWLLQEKDPKEALVYAERAAKLAPDAPSVLDTLAWTKWLLNDKTGALPLLQRARAKDPADGEIGYHLVLALDGNGQHADAQKLLAEVLASQRPFLDRKNAESLSEKWR